MKRICLKIFVATTTLAISASAAIAGPLMDRLEKNEPIRIGFANEVPWAFPGEDKQPRGFVNAYTIGVLKQMGYENIEPVVTEWGGLIPGLKAGRIDMVTGGLYIIKSRCENVAFSEPLGKFGDAFIVAKGNPKEINNYIDVKEKDGVLVTGAGYNSIEAARKQGLPDDKVMTVPGPTEILAAVRAGRADAGAVTYFTALNLAKESGGTVDVTDPAALPDWTLNWVGIGFRPEDQDFVDKFNAAQKAYLGTPEMMKTVADYGYSEAQLPGDKTSEWVCNNR